jgi:hypothetical protein
MSKRSNKRVHVGLKARREAWDTITDKTGTKRPGSLSRKRSGAKSAGRRKKR